MSEGETLAGPALDDVADRGPLTLGGLLVDRCTRFANYEALVFDDALQGGRTVRWTYAELLRRSRAVAKSLLALGLGKGARVGILMGNRPDAVASFFGAALAGAVAVPLSTFAPKGELSFLIAHADLSVLLLQTTMDERRFADDIADLCPAATGLAPFGDPQFPYLSHVAVLGPPADAAGLRSWDRFIDHGHAVVSDALLDAVAEQVHPSDHALIVYSSGTTDLPKGILHNHEAVTRQFWTQARLFGRDECDAASGARCPLFWTAGMNAGHGRHAGGRGRLGDAGALRRGTGARPHGAGTCHRAAHVRPPGPGARGAPRLGLDRPRLVHEGLRQVGLHPAPVGHRRSELEHADRLRLVGDVVVLHRLAMRRTTRRAAQRQLRPPPPRERAPGGRPCDRRGARSRSGGRAVRAEPEPDGAPRQADAP